MSSSTSQSESPFLDVHSFEMPSPSTARVNGISSPFVEAFLAEHAGTDRQGATRRVLLAELYDEEFNDALYEAIGEITAHSGNGATLDAATAKLRITPLLNEVESFIQRVADEFGARDASGITEAEIDEVMSRIDTGNSQTPEFERLFGSIKNAFKRVAKGAVSLAKKGVEAAATLGLGPLLKIASKLVPTLIKRVLEAAINRLPVAVQPAARQLAGKLPTLFGSELEAADRGDGPAVDVGAIQSEFNERVADLLLSGEADVNADYETNRWTSARDGSEVAISDVDAARERFMGQLEQLQDGEDAGPAVEQFIPALLPALKLGVRVVGRKRVVGLLSGLVSKLIGRFVGPASSGALSTAMVDAGLKLIGLEVSDADQQRSGSAAIAATVEETVRRVAALPDAVLDNQTLLEGSILREFESAAASNLPPILSDAVYRRRPDLVETDSRRGMWIPFPIRGPKRYKKFSRVIKTRITPHAAMTVTTFGEAPLSQFLQEQLGLDPGEDLEADIHLYESVMGTVLGEVARLDANGNGGVNTAEFHPLTPEAAALLIREPGLGRPASASSRGAANGIAVGQRFYRIAVPGRRVAPIPGHGSKGQARRRTSLYTVLDFPQDRIRLFLFLSERRAQELSAALRKQGHAGTAATSLKGYIDRGLAAATHGHVSGRIRMVHEALSLEEARGRALERLPRSAVQTFVTRVGEWTLSALSDYLSNQSARFIAATEDAGDGVTVVITLANPPGMAAMRKAVAGTGGASERGLSGTPASVQIDVVAGFTNG